MSEYILRDASGCDMSGYMDDGRTTVSEWYAKNNTDHYGTLHEEIVRCRDCSKWRFFDVDGGVRFGTCGEWERADSYCKPATREDGFCAWGERRDA